MSADILSWLKRHDKAIEKLNAFDVPKPSPVFLLAPLTSVSWTGSTHSTTAKTLIDLSAVFGVPAGVKAVAVRTFVKDSASSGATNFGYYLLLSPNNTAGSGDYGASPNGMPDSVWHYDQGIVGCDANGDIYYQIVASGAGTFAVYIQILGYWL